MGQPVFCEPRQLLFLIVTSGRIVSDQWTIKISNCHTPYDVIFWPILVRQKIISNQFDMFTMKIGQLKSLCHDTAHVTILTVSSKFCQLIFDLEILPWPGSTAPILAWIKIHIFLPTLILTFFDKKCLTVFVNIFRNTVVQQYLRIFLVSLHSIVFWLVGRLNCGLLHEVHMIS